MHEYSIALSVLQSVDTHRRNANADRVVEVFVRIGDRSGVNATLLETAWEVARRGTCCDTAELVIQTVPETWRCVLCERDAEPGELLQCPTCGLPLTLVSGDELLLDRVILEQSEPAPSAQPARAGAGTTSRSLP